VVEKGREPKALARAKEIDKTLITSSVSSRVLQVALLLSHRPKRVKVVRKESAMSRGTSISPTSHVRLVALLMSH
jgi:hypothetical protein